MPCYTKTAAKKPQTKSVKSAGPVVKKKTATRTSRTDQPTISEVLNELRMLSQQMDDKQETLESGFNKVQDDIGHLQEHFVKLADQEQTDAEKAKIDILKLTERLDNLSLAVRQTSRCVEENVSELKHAVDEQLEVSKPYVPEIINKNPVLSTAWHKMRRSLLFRFFIIGLACFLLFEFYINVIKRPTGGLFPPSIVQPGYDVNTPTGAASLEVSREPFRSDTASRRAFGSIFARLDELVNTGQLTDFEGYYNEFGRGIQSGIDAGKYDRWADFWNRIAAVCHRYGNGANDLRAFNANLQSAARVVAGFNDYNGGAANGFPGASPGYPGAGANSGSMPQWELPRSGNNVPATNGFPAN